MSVAKRILTMVTCVSLAGCSSIGAINGVDLNGPRMGVVDSGPQPYCEQNDQQRWMCILAGAAIVGGLFAIVASHGHDNNYSSPPI